MSYSLILFDLDGTLTNSEPGITGCAALALKKMGFPVPPQETLRKFIGPPLWSSFVNYCGLTEEQAEQAVLLYRETYNVTGAFQNAPYPGIPELLEELKQKKISLAVATSKPENIALPVLDYFHLTPYFDFISAPDENEHSSNKDELIRSALNARHVPAEQAVMVGDTRFDAAGAREAGTQFIGVLYGFGTQEEMEHEGASVFAKDIPTLKALLLQ
ncbi:HAD hydrolase-like protein [Caproiciproducens sp. LBM24188]|nr:HAD hydrolase-like protein [Clostridiales bacterium]